MTKKCQDKTRQRMVAAMRKCLSDPNRDPAKIIDEMRDVTLTSKARMEARALLYTSRSFAKLVAEFDTGWPGYGQILYGYALAWR